MKTKLEEIILYSIKNNKGKLKIFKFDRYYGFSIISEKLFYLEARKIINEKDYPCIINLFKSLIKYE